MTATYYSEDHNDCIRYLEKEIAELEATAASYKQQLSDMAVEVEQLTRERNGYWLNKLKELTAAQAEIERQKTCIRAMTDQIHALVVEKNSLLMDHGGKLCDDAYVQSLKSEIERLTNQHDMDYAVLAGDNIVLNEQKAEIERLKVDAERLDFLDEASKCNSKYTVWAAWEGGESNVRAAIDAARKEMK